MKAPRSFASDNNAGIHPEVLKAITAVNEGHAVAYGGDEVTARAQRKFRAEFGDESEAFFVFNGTAANVVGLQAMTRSYEAVICAETAHIHVDECGAPEKFTGSKLLTVPTKDGKLTPELVRNHCRGLGDQHHVQPRVISITQSTEFGTLYSLDEIRALADLAHAKSMYLHMDGARISNAVAALNVSLREATRDAGVDVLSFGGTKNGIMLGEAVVFFKPELATNFKYIRKQGMQLASKMRFIAAQFEALLTDELWRKNALHANAMAKLLAKEVSEIPGVRITQKVEANGVFATIPPGVVAELQKSYGFYIWNEATTEARWMCSFDTTEEDVISFSRRLRELSQQ